MFSENDGSMFGELHWEGKYRRLGGPSDRVELAPIAV